MDAIYPVFARVDDVFYDHPRLLPPPPDEPPFQAEGVSGWRCVDDGIWTYYEPPGGTLPEQGWKIHLSVVSSRARDLLGLVGRYCGAHGLAFKHLSGPGVLRSTNAKDAGREGSGKFVTIYTVSETQLHEALLELGRLTADIDGPHILSDLRWRQGPVFVRYGGFHRLFVEVDGASVPAIRHPDGSLVPDVRAPAFLPPSWVDIPPFLAALADEYAQRTPPAGFPDVTGALHHSNAGGIYVAHEDGRDVIVKEARPHAGMTPDGRDAVARSRDEAAALRTLRSCAGVTRLLRTFEVLDHHYLVLERAPGVPLHQAVVARHPLVRAEASDAEVAAYRDWALAVCRRMRDVVADVHAAGLTHGDLHPGNFLIDDDGGVVLIDFEMARPMNDPSGAVIGAPGFVAPAQAQGVDADLFALHRVTLFVFAPLAPLLDLHERKEGEIVAWVRERFSIDADAAGSLSLDASSPPAYREDVGVANLSRQLLTDATPDREDRLWPGDPAQFDEPAYALAHGALGPVLALHAAAHEIPVRLLEWVERSCLTAPVRPGLLDGLDGAAVVFDRLGNADLADELLGRSLAAPVRWDAPGAYGGPTGSALAWLRLLPRHPELLGRARGVFDEVAERAKGWSTRSATPIATGLSGILRGPSGDALLAMRLYDVTGDTALLGLADAAIRTDLARCVPGGDDALLLDEGWRLLPYLASGSAGIGVAISELVQRHPASDLADVLGGLARAAAPEFVLEPGLFQGRAGLILALRAIHARREIGVIDPRHLVRHIENLRLHAVPRPVGIGIPGRNLLRLSCDLATGSAGVLWAMATLHTGSARTLPFLDLPPVDAPLLGATGPGGGETHGLLALTSEPRSR